MSSQDISLRVEAPRHIAASTLRRRLLARVLGRSTRGRITVECPSGGRQVFDSGAAGSDAYLQLRRDRAISRLGLGGDIGFAEAFIDGDWDTPDLVGLLRYGVENQDSLDGALSASVLHKVWNRVRHAMRANTRAGSRRNVAFHYDLGNAFYARWLDTTMSYSAALFDRPGQDLAGAQDAKYRRLADTVGLRRGERVLEIGCGWGGFAETAVRGYGCDVVGLTLSKEQRLYTESRMRRTGCRKNAEVRLQDYRDATGEYDAIVSIEMFEAVGEENWPAFFDKLRTLLKPGGRAGIQVITINERRFETYRRRPDFIQKYIFPGGMLPSPTRFESLARSTGLQIADRFFFGDSYAETLRQWHANFLAAWPEIAELGFDERFLRMWTYYLAYCEVGFRTGAIDVAQYTLIRP